MTATTDIEFIKFADSKVCVDRGGVLPSGWLDYRDFPHNKKQPQTVPEAIQLYQDAARAIKLLLEASPISVIVSPNLWSQLTPLLSIR